MAEPGAAQMSADEPKPYHDTVPLREYIDALFAERQRAVDAALDQHNRALDLLDTLKANEALQRERIEGMRRGMEDRFKAAEVAIAKSESATEKRFESVNEFRAQMADQSQRFMMREVSEAKFDEHSKQIQALTQTMTAWQSTVQGQMSGKTSLVSGTVAAITTIIAIVSVIVLLIRK